MKITVVSGERSVVVKVKGSSPARMKEAEALATRLLTVGQTEAPAKPPIGFTAATVAETEVVGDAPTNGNEVE